MNNNDHNIESESLDFDYAFSVHHIKDREWGNSLLVVLIGKALN